MLFCSMFAIEPDNYNSNSCSALTKVNNPLYKLGYFLALNIGVFSKYAMWDLFGNCWNNQTLV